MKISKTDATRVFEAVGVENSSKWTPKRMTDKINKIDNLIESPEFRPADEEVAGLLDKILDAIDNDEGVVVVAKIEDDEDTAAAKPTRGKAKAKSEAAAAGDEADAKPKRAVKKRAAKSKRAEKAAAEKEAKSKLAEKAAAEKAKPAAKAKKDNDDGGKPAAKAKKDNDDGGKPAGVRRAATRPYLAGVVIAKHGLDVGITDDMVDELDELSGKPNPNQSVFILKTVWHGLRGFQGLENDDQE